MFEGLFQPMHLLVIAGIAIRSFSNSSIASMRSSSSKPSPKRSSNASSRFKSPVSKDA